jgi:hypothetical protein
MRSSRGRILIFTSAVVAAVSATAYAAPASVTRAHAGGQIVDRTYSCRNAPNRVFFFGTQVRLPPGGQVPAGPAMASVTTAADHAFQVVFKDVKNSLKVDKSVCRPSSRPVALKPSGLAKDQTVTPAYAGHSSGKCPAHAKRVLVHFRIAMTGGTPERALLAVRQDRAKGRPLAFFKWSPRKITDYVAKSCTTY